MKRIAAIALLLTLWASPGVAQTVVPIELEAETSDGDDGSATTAGPFFRAQAFSDWESRFWASDNFNEFRLRRAEIGAGWRWPQMGGFFVNLEGVRSAQPDSLLGVAGNSIVMRVKHAFAYGRPELGPGRLLLQAGMVEDVWVATVESFFDLRGHGATSSQRSGFFVSSDLGANVGYSLLDDLVALQVSITNGEGRNELELNRGKNTTIVLSSVPVRFDLLGESARVGIHGGYRDGSLGVGLSRNHRIYGGAGFAHPRFGAGVEFVRALGILENGGVEAQLLGGWLRGEPLARWVGLFARYELHTTDLDGDDSARQTIQAGAYSDLLDVDHSRVRLYLAGELGLRGENAPEVPGVPDATEYQAVRLTVDATGLFTPVRSVDPAEE